jgi:hypothetical protein
MLLLSNAEEVKRKQTKVPQKLTIEDGTLPLGSFLPSVCTRPPAQSIFFHAIFFKQAQTVSKFYNFRASLNHRANACSCFN